MPSELLLIVHSRPVSQRIFLTPPTPLTTNTRHWVDMSYSTTLYFLLLMANTSYHVSAVYEDDSRRYCRLCQRHTMCLFPVMYSRDKDNLAMKYLHRDLYLNF